VGYDKKRRFVVKKLLFISLTGIIALQAHYECPLRVYSSRPQSFIQAHIANHQLMLGSDPVIGELVVSPRTDGSFSVGWVHVLGPQNQEAPGLTSVIVAKDADGYIYKDLINAHLYSFPVKHYVIDPDHNICGNAAEFAATHPHMAESSAAPSVAHPAQALAAKPGLITLNIRYEDCGGGRRLLAMSNVTHTLLGTYPLGEGPGTTLLQIPHETTMLALEDRHAERRHGSDIAGYESHTFLNLYDMNLHAGDTINIYANCDREVLELVNPADVNL
jgi:hypothetical protein